MKETAEYPLVDKFAFRQAENSDLPLVEDIFIAAMRPYIESARGSWDVAREREQFRRQLVLGSTEVVQTSAGNVGFLTLLPHDEGLELHTLCIDPAHQGLGLGASVIRHVLSAPRARGQTVLLSVLRTNPRAQAFYERLGFVVCGGSEHHIRMSITRSARSEA